MSLLYFYFCIKNRKKDILMEEDKKSERKRKRFAARLKSSKGIICTETPGKNVVLCNVGQATGLDKDTILKFVLDSSLGITQPMFVWEKGETHSFLVFSSTEEALLFYNKFNGKCKINGSSTLYMNFVDSVPNNEIICQHENPNGLTILDDFITEKEENIYLSVFDWHEPIDSANLKNRQVKHYGYEFRYGSNDVDLTSPLKEKIPKECEELWRRLRAKSFDVGVPDQLTVNKYEPGQGIPSHVDRHSPFGSTILSLSLGSSVVMEWKHHSGKYVPVVVPARSMMIMQGEARYDWQHGIQPRTHDPVIETRLHPHPHKVVTSDTAPRHTRVSLTFRWTRPGPSPCRCGYAALCDSAEKADLGDEVAASLEELHVHQVYEQIAGHFSTTRLKPWPRVAQFTQQVPVGCVVLDLGAGNGKNMLRRSDVFQVAGERSGALLAECRRRVRVADTAGGAAGGAAGAAGGAADCVRLDALRPGLRDRSADVVLCVAVIHHFSTQARRLQSIRSISRLLRAGGRALITVWAKDQTTSSYLCKNKAQGSGQVVSVSGVHLPVHENRTQFKHSDLLVPWKLRRKTDDKLENRPESTLLRYYHVFEEGELEKLCLEIKELAIEESFYEEGNWCVICRKL